MKNNRLMTFGQLQNIRGAEPITIMRQVAADNQVYADFFEYKPQQAIDPNAGLYFVVCPDVNLLIDLKKHPDQFQNILECNKKMSNHAINCYYNLVNISELNSENVFALHNDMCRAIQDIAVLRNSFYEFGYTLPQYVMRPTVDNLANFQIKRNAADMPGTLRARYDEILERAVSDAFARYNKADFKRVKTLPFSKHRVKASYFMKNHISAVYDVVDEPLYKYMKKQLSNYPDFIYCIEALPSLHLKDNSHFDGPEELNFWKNQTEVKEYNIGFPAFQQDIFYRIMIDYNCRQFANQRSYHEMLNSTSDLKSLLVDVNDMWNINSLAGANNVAYCINRGEMGAITADSVSKMTIGIRAEDESIWNGIISRLGREQRGYAIVTSNHRKTAEDNRPKNIKNPFIDTSMGL